MAPDLTSVAWPIRTERLLIRPATPADVEPTWEYRRKPGVSDWLTIGANDHDLYVKRALEPDRLAKTLVLELDGAVIGDLMIAIHDAWAQAEVVDRAKGVQAELGWVLDPAQARQGFATEAAKALLRICFDELGLRRVIAQCFADNAPSWRLMERLGMRREQHTIRDSLHRSGDWLDGMSYALLAEEWRAAT